MKLGITPLERAFELAKSGRLSSVSEIRRALSKEGYETTQMDGPLLRRQIMAIIKASAGGRDDPSPLP